jgi:flagellar biosynthesis/type III secretory pathway protein FliH
LEIQFNLELNEIVESENMPYITSIERIAQKRGFQEGIQQGIQQGIQEGIRQGIRDVREMLLHAIETRFKVVPDDIDIAINRIEARSTLKSLIRQAITCKSLDSFRKKLQLA